MSYKASLEATISLASEIKGQLKRLSDVYTSLPAIIQKEHLAVQSRSIAAQEAATQEKLAAGDTVEEALGQLSIYMKRLFVIYEQICGSKINPPQNVSQCVSGLRQIQQAFPKDTMGIAVLEHVVRGIESALREFTEAHAKVGPIIETNRLVMQGLLRNHQENVHFWRRIQDEALSSYSPRKAPKKNSSPTLLNVRA